MWKGFESQLNYLSKTWNEWLRERYARIASECGLCVRDLQGVQKAIKSASACYGTMDLVTEPTTAAFWS